MFIFVGSGHIYEMRCFIVTLLLLIESMSMVMGQNTCASPAIVTDGNCTTFSAAVNTGAILTGCNGGNHPLAYLRFTAPANGDCVQLNFSGITTGGTYQLATFTAGCASYVTSSAACVENVVAGQPFSYSSESGTGANLFTPGQTYVLMIQSNTPTSITACMQTPSAPAAPDQCTGAQQIGTTNTTLYNGGDCNYSGSVDNAASIDPPAIQLCAGSLENTQWTSFVAQAATIQIVGSSISCTGGGCGFQFGIFTGTCGALTNLGCYGNKVCTGGQSTAGPTNPLGQIAWSGTSTSGFTATISGLSVGQTVFLVMDGNADADCQYTLAGVNVFAVPVELISFNGYRQEHDVSLRWTTASELNNAYFSIERSENNEDFFEIGRVIGSLNSSEETDYEFVDEGADKGMCYYRLCQVDINGDKTYSTTISVRPDTSIKTLVRRMNMLGAVIAPEVIAHGFVIEVYDDMSIRKVWYE